MAQTQSKIFVSPAFAMGYNLRSVQIDTDRALGWETNPRSFAAVEGGKSFKPFHTKMGLDLGITIADRFDFFTGMYYTTRVEEGILVCELCGFSSPSSPVRLRHDFWNIPLGFLYLNPYPYRASYTFNRMEVNRKSPFTPFRKWAGK